MLFELHPKRDRDGQIVSFFHVKEFVGIYDFNILDLGNKWLQAAF